MVIFKPTTKKELQKALMDWTYDDEGSEKKYGPINKWDISLLDDLGLDGESLFQAGKDEVNKTTIESNFKLAKSLGLRGTPASIVNDSIYPGYVKYESLQSLTSQ